MSKGKFIVVEGCDGSGKTEVVHMLADKMQQLGFKVHITREPGGTPINEKIRNIIVNGHPDEPLENEAELLLFGAARIQSIALAKRLIDEGYYVITDRYTLSTTLIQGTARGGEGQLLYEMVESALVKLRADHTILVDSSLGDCLDRSVKRGVKCRIGDDVELVKREWVAYNELVTYVHNGTPFGCHGKVSVISNNSDLSDLKTNVHNWLTTAVQDKAL